MKDSRPSFFSLSFHSRFFPSLLWRRLRPKQEGYPSPFTHHLPIEFIILTFVSIAAAIVGLTAGVGSGSFVGLGFGVLGLAGLVALFIHSIHSQAGTRPSFDSFGIAVFFFFVVLGLTAGLFAGFLRHSFWLGFWGGVLGVMAGYGVGIFAGLSIQYLGWMEALFDHLALAAIVGMIVLDCVLLSSLFF